MSLVGKGYIVLQKPMLWSTGAVIQDLQTQE